MSFFAGWLYLLRRHVRRRGGWVGLFRFYRKMIARNHVSFIMGLVLIFMVGIVINLTVKLEQARQSPTEFPIPSPTPYVKPEERTDPSDIPEAIPGNGPPPPPPLPQPGHPSPIGIEDRGALQNLRRYTQDRLMELDDQ